MCHQKSLTLFAWATAILNMVVHVLMFAFLLHTTWNFVQGISMHNTNLEVEYKNLSDFESYKWERAKNGTPLSELEEVQGVLLSTRHRLSLRLSSVLFFNLLRTTAFFISAIPSFYAACKLLVATQLGSKFEEAKSNFDGYKLALLVVAVISIISSGVFLCSNNDWSWAALNILPLTDHILCMLPMLFLLKKIENEQRMEGNKKLNLEVIVTKTEN